MFNGGICSNIGKYPFLMQKATGLCHSDTWPPQKETLDIKTTNKEETKKNCERTRDELFQVVEAQVFFLSFYISIYILRVHCPGFFQSSFCVSVF